MALNNNVKEKITQKAGCDQLLRDTVISILKGVEPGVRHRSDMVGIITIIVAII